MELGWGSQSNWGIMLLLYIFIRLSRASLDISYCSSNNNAGSNQPMWSEYQSTGLCGDHCQGAFAFAVLQGNNCWCSNYVPADQEDTYQCNQGCPGIDTEWCGNTDQGLFAYFILSAGEPLGTSGAGSSNTAPSTSSSSSVSTTWSSSSSSSPSPFYYSSSSVRSSSRPSSTSLVTVVAPQSSIQTSAPSTVSSTPPSSTSIESPSSKDTPPSSLPVAPISTPSSSSDQSAATSTPAPTAVYTSVTTVTGRVQTVIVTPSSTGTADATLGQSSTAGGHGVSTGKVVGIVLGVALGLGLIIGILVWLWFRRKRRHDMRELSPEGSFVAEGSGGNSSGGNSVPSRQVSQMSTAGLLGKAPRIMTNGLMGGGDLRSAGTQSPNINRRSLGTDQRLNPWALYSQEDRSSSVSLQDNQDYSRQLRVANPDA